MNEHNNLFAMKNSGKLFTNNKQVYKGQQILTVNRKCGKIRVLFLGKEDKEGRWCSKGI